MEASKSLTDGSFGSTPGSCRNKELLLGTKHIAYHSTNQCGQWRKEEHYPPYKHAAAYGAAMVGIPSKIAYGSFKKITTAIAAI